jgi:hypothetical protein
MQLLHSGCCSRWVDGLLGWLVLHTAQQQMPADTPVVYMYCATALQLMTAHVMGMHAQTSCSIIW